MPVVSHRIRYFLIALVLTWMALVLLTRPAHGAWSADPVQVHATTALCPAVSAIDDGHFGAIIIWQENTATGGLLKAQHLLASGDLDPAWSGPALVSDKDVARTETGAASDGAGGAYVWWMEGAQLYLSRLAAQGAVAGGWPAGGRAMGALVDADSRPIVRADGSGGVYVAWLTTSGILPAWIVVRAYHLGPANTPMGGWPGGGLTLGNTVANSENVNGRRSGGGLERDRRRAGRVPGRPPGDVTRLLGPRAAHASHGGGARWERWSVRPLRRRAGHRPGRHGLSPATCGRDRGDRSRLARRWPVRIAGSRPHRL